MTERKIALTTIGTALLIHNTAPMSMTAPHSLNQDGSPIQPKATFVYLLKIDDTNKDKNGSTVP